MHRPTSPTSKASTAADAVLEIETFTIRPNEGHKVLLGVFHEGTAPKFRVIYHDHSLESPNVVSYHDITLSGNDVRCQIYRHFESYSQVPHTITVRYASRVDKELSLAE